MISDFEDLMFLWDTFGFCFKFLHAHCFPVNSKFSGGVAVCVLVAHGSCVHATSLIPRPLGTDEQHHSAFIEAQVRVFVALQRLL